jgi:hypothetical protein
VAATRKTDHLYASETEIAELVLGPGKLRDWRDRAKILERRGLPQIDPLMGGRYWPAVRAFFDRLNGLTDRRIPTRPDGPENFKCQAPRKKSSTSPPATPSASSDANE